MFTFAVYVMRRVGGMHLRVYLLKFFPLTLRRSVYRAKKNTTREVSGGAVVWWSCLYVRILLCSSLWWLLQVRSTWILLVLQAFAVRRCCLHRSGIPKELSQPAEH